MPQRTPDLDVDTTFELDVEITKAAHEANGQRLLRGVASGVLEDLDGERVSARAIRKMAAEARAGKIKLTTRHHEDWADEIGDVVKVDHDPEHDELLVEAVLPPEGEDGLADKAWTRLTKRGEKLGYSIGGKCRKAFFEVTETGKRRKVLDDIALRHVCLTKKPSYSPSFAEAVLKSAAAVELPDDAQWVDVDKIDDPSKDDFDADVAKDTPANRSRADQSRSSASGDANAGTKGDKTPSTDVNQDDDDDGKDTPTADLPKARHLACPNCGHEFAAELSAEDPPKDRDTGDKYDNDDDAATKKSAAREETPHMADKSPLDETLEQLRGIAAGEDTTKTADEPAEPAEVDKTEPVETGDDDVLKMVAASHRQNGEAIAKTDQRIAKLQSDTADALGHVVKAVNDLSEYVQKLPTGRRSVARRAPDTPPSKEDLQGEVSKTATRTAEDDVQKRIDDAPDLLSALKIRNAADFGVPAE